MKQKIAFRDRLMKVVNQIEPISRSAALADMNLMLESGIDSFAKLSGTAANQSLGTDMRLIACWFLSRMSDNRAVPSLVKCLNDKDPALRSEAARALGTLGDPRAVPQLIKLLKGDSSSDVRFYAIYGLGLLQSDSAVAPILRVLENDSEDPGVRGIAAETLSVFGGEQVIESLINCLTDRQAEVRYWAAFSLGEMGARSALSGLRRLAETDQSSLSDGRSVHKEAAEAIGKIRKGNGD